MSMPCSRMHWAKSSIACSASASVLSAPVGGVVVGRAVAADGRHLAASSEPPPPQAASTVSAGEGEGAEAGSVEVSQCHGPDGATIGPESAPERA